LNAVLRDIEAFLAGTPPFDLLEAPLRRQAAAAMEVIYRRAGTVLLEIGERNQALPLLRRGAVEAHDATGTLVGRYGEGESYGLQSLLTGNPARFRITLIEDGLIWLLPKSAFDRLRAESPAFERFYLQSLEERLAAALAREAEGQQRGDTLFMTPLGELARRAPVMVGPDTPIGEAARRMSEHGISSLLVGEGDKLAGIVTDRDLRNRVLAAGRDPGEPVRNIMTADPICLEDESPVVEGILAMAGRGIHHLPLLRKGRVVGMVTTRDLMSLQTQHPLYLAAQIQKQDSREGVIEVCRRVPRLFELLVASGLRAERVPQVLTTISDAVARRLIALAERELGPAPAPYAWIAFGSQARAEQSLKTDQDNGLVYADEAPPEAEAYFARLGEYVCEALDACGYPRCPGNIMASNPELRQPLGRWRRRFQAWVDTPDPEGVLRVGIFFDLRAVCGDVALGRGMREALADAVTGKDKGIFLATLARHAVEYDVPLGFFRQFVLEDRGEHRETLELKASGLLPLTDLVRVRALAAGITEPSTPGRLNALLEGGRLHRRDVDRLLGAHRLLSGLRVRLHAEQVRAGAQALHNHLDPRRIGHDGRAALRDAFMVLREAQKGLASDFQVG
jgi:CBS domain-containing protein